MTLTKGGVNTKGHLTVDAYGMPVRVIVTADAKADCRYGKVLMDGFKTEHVLADKAYDTHKIVTYATEQGIDVVIPPKKNRVTQRGYDTHQYRYRHWVENALMVLKQWRVIAFRFAKRTASFQAALQIRIIFT